MVNADEMKRNSKTEDFLDLTQPLIKTTIIIKNNDVKTQSKHFKLSIKYPVSLKQFSSYT